MIGMNFKDVAHKTVAELFDMLKAKEAAIQEMDEVIKLQDADLRKYEKQIEGLKAQLNNMEACYIGIKKINDEQSAIIQGHFAARQDIQKRIDEYEKLTTSIRNEFNLWTDGREFADVIEVQIENLEALRGGS